MVKHEVDAVRGRTLQDLEQEQRIGDEMIDISDRYVGIPRHKKFYREGEVDFGRMRKRFESLLRRLGLKAKEPGPK